MVLRISVIEPVKVTNTGNKELRIVHEGPILPIIELPPGKSDNLFPGKWRVVVQEYEPVIIARIQYDEKRFSVEAERGVEGAQFTSDVPVRPKD